eukprot:TRINITY_DN4208_c0_g1_i1.p1 TRINITY_DN4208_c0_g1~~TRINITY_DN4208_c0_g1_i1.p1  ORF type:complete len:356 (-),score=52.25 TRINITY_DN4208_c0_g1_i1:136-1203(-)
MNLVPFSIYYVMLAGLIGVGFGQGIYSAALFTVFSDSIPTGKRTEWMSYARISYYIGTLTGPIMSIVILKLHGNDRWTLDDLLLPSTIGIVIFGLSLLVTFFFRESWKLAQESENIQKELSRRGNAAKKFLWFSSDKHVPYLLCIADVLSGFASGMTVKFFPLFFENIIHIDPISLQVVYLVRTLSVATLLFLCQKFSQMAIGRMGVVLTTKYIGVALGLLLASGERYFWDIPWLVCVVWVLRGAFMNCSLMILKSILNDYTTKETRNTWNSIDSITGFGWSGSAVLGGYLIDKVHFQWVFIITFGLQLLSIFPHWILLFLVEKEMQIDVSGLEMETEGLLLEKDPGKEDSDEED